MQDGGLRCQLFWQLHGLTLSLVSHVCTAGATHAWRQIEGQPCAYHPGLHTAAQHTSGCPWRLEALSGMRCALLTPCCHFQDACLLCRLHQCTPQQHEPCYGQMRACTAHPGSTHTEQCQELLNDHAPTHHTASGASPGTTQAHLIALPALQFSLKALHTNFGAGTVGHMPLRLSSGDEHYKCIQRLPELLLLSRATCNRLNCVPGQGLSFVNACLSLWSDWQSQRGCAVARLSRAEAASVPCVTVPAATRISESMQWHGAVRVESRWPVDTTSKRLAHLSQSAVRKHEVPLESLPAHHHERMQISHVSG